MNMEKKMKKFKISEIVLYEIISFIFSMTLVLKNEIGYGSGLVENFLNNFHFSLWFFIK